MKEKGQEAGRYSSVRHKDTEEGKKEVSRRSASKKAEGEAMSLAEWRIGRLCACPGSTLEKSQPVVLEPWEAHTGSVHAMGGPGQGQTDRALLLTLSQHTAPVPCVLGPSKSTSAKMKKGTHIPGPVQRWGEVPSLNEDIGDSRCTERGGPQPPPPVWW